MGAWRVGRRSGPFREELMVQQVPSKGTGPTGHKAFARLQHATPPYGTRATRLGLCHDETAAQSGSAAQPALAGASQSDVRSRRIRTWSLFAAGDDGSYRGSARHKAAVLVRHHSHKPQSRTPMCQQTESPQHHHVPYMPRGYNSQNHATQHLKGSRPGGQPYTIGMPWYTGCSISTNTSRAIL